MKKIIFLFLILNCFCMSAFASSFYSCKGKFALCTTAACTPVSGKKGVVSCKCDVREGFSVGEQQCQPVQKTSQGELVYSRYYPIRSYVVCQNNRDWAWCLDKKCIIDKKNPSKASCACTTVNDKGPYIIVTPKITAGICTTGIISSATMNDVNAVNNFIKTQKEPKAYPIKVLKNN